MILLCLPLAERLTTNQCIIILRNNTVCIVLYNDFMKYYIILPELLTPAKLVLG